MSRPCAIITCNHVNLRQKGQKSQGHDIEQITFNATCNTWGINYTKGMKVQAYLTKKQDKYFDRNILLRKVRIICIKASLKYVTETMQSDMI